MSITLPTNINFLSPNGFRLFVHKLPYVDFFVQKFPLPGVNLGYFNQPTTFAPIPQHGDITFNDLTLTMKVSEDLQSYFEIWNWIVELGFPEHFGQFKTIVERNVSNNPWNKQGDTVSDMTLFIENNSHITTAEVVFWSAFPVSIGDLVFSSTESTVNYLTVDVTFKYILYTIRKYAN